MLEFSHQSIIYFSIFDRLFRIFLEASLYVLGDINFTRSPCYHESSITFLAGLIIYGIIRQFVVEYLGVAALRVSDVKLL